MRVLIGLLTILAIVAIYFLPTIVAFKRKYKNRMSVFIINLFLGWTLVGWVVALALSFINDIDENKKQSDKAVKLIGILGIFVFAIFAIIAFIGYKKYNKDSIANPYFSEQSNISDNKKQNPATLLFKPHILGKMSHIKEMLENLSPNDVELAYAEGGNVNAKTEYYTVLMYASMYCRNPEVLNVLIKHGAKVNDANSYGKTALMSASQYNENPEIIETLIINGAYVDAQDKYGETALGYACEYNKNSEVTEMLIAKGADVNMQQSQYENNTALNYAIKNNNTPDVTEILLKNGAKIDRGHIKDICYAKNPETIKVLMNYGVDIKKEKVCCYGSNLLMAASKWNENSEVLQFLIDNGISVNSVEDNGKNALMYACDYNKNIEVIKTLIRNGADLNAKDKKGKNAFMYLFNVDKYNKHYATIESTQLFIDNNVDINATDNEGKTTLMYACENVKDIAIIEKLLENNADVNAKDKKGNTVYDYAKKNKNILSSKIKAVLNKYQK